MFGVINLNKPVGITSRKALNELSRLCPERGVKFGHAGTLDPLASGVLVVCVGHASRLIQYGQGLGKKYVGDFRLGETSDTEDSTGNVSKLENAPLVEKLQFENVLKDFIGDIPQTPPSYSAIRVNGKRAHELARNGKVVTLAPRIVSIHSIKLLSFEYPDVRLEIACGKGTYVRTLGRDIAKALGSDAVMTRLVRTGIGGFGVDEASELNQITRVNFVDHLLPAQRIVSGLPQVALNETAIENLRFGRPAWTDQTFECEHVAGVSQSGELVAVLEPSGCLLKPKINYAPTQFPES
jgi:tRNA pseudouridine55 synthase